MKISFVTTPEDHETIVKIVDRAIALRMQLIGKSTYRMAITMDVTAAHANGCRLDLGRLLTTDDNTFAHDVFGISRHIDRDSGKLENFMPKCHSRNASGEG